MSQNTSIESEVSRLTRRAELLRMASEVFAEDPDFRADFVRLVTADRNGVASNNGKRATGKTHVQKVEDYLKAEDNCWRTIRKIAPGAGLSVTAVGQVLYRSARSKFEKRLQPGKKKTRQWRMKIK